MRHYFLIGCVSLLVFQPRAQGYKNVQIPAVSAKYPFNECEPSIAINPNNPDEIAAGTVLSGYHYSKDGGQSWQTKSLKSKYGVYGDPVLHYDALGRLYYLHLSDYKKTSHLDRIVCQYTDQIEGNFSKGSFPAPNGTKVQDKHWVVIDPHTHAIYMTWTQFDAYDSADPKDSSVILFSKSLNRGQSWSEPIRISKFGGDCRDSDNTVEGAVPALGKNGEIFVCWTGPRGIMFQCSKDGGQTWLLEEKQLTDHVGGWDIDIPGIYRANGLPFLMADMSNGSRDGTLYLNWCDQRNGSDDTDVWLMSSSDGGTTWTQAKRVNQDPPGKQQFLTSMAVDQKNGDLHFIYYDRRRFKTNSTDVVWAKSSDGGLSFSEEIISTRPFLPNPEIFFGDYLGIAAHNGRVRPIWPRMDNGVITLWTALIDPK